MRIWAAATTILLAGTLTAQQVPHLTRAEQEEFLLKAKVVRTKGTPNGITGTIRATLSDGVLTHDAQIQTIDESKPKFEGTRGTEFNFRDSYKYNIAGYKLDKLLDIRMIPVSVERSYEGKSGAFTWWIDDVMMEELDRQKKKLQAPEPELWNLQMYIVRVFDQLIYNVDRNLGNLLITKNWDIWMIDHTRAFRTHETLMTAKDLVKCDRDLLAKLKALDPVTVRREMDRYLTSAEIKGLLARRDRIVSLFEKAGDKALYNYPRREL